MRGGCDNTLCPMMIFPPVRILVLRSGKQHSWSEHKQIRAKSSHEELLFFVFISQDKWPINVLSLSIDENTEEGHVFFYGPMSRWHVISTILVSAVYLIKRGGGGWSICAYATTPLIQIYSHAPTHTHTHRWVNTQQLYTFTWEHSYTQKHISGQYKGVIYFTESPFFYLSFIENIWEDFLLRRHKSTKSTDLCWGYTILKKKNPNPVKSKYVSIKKTSCWNTTQSGLVISLKLLHYFQATPSIWCTNCLFILGLLWQLSSDICCTPYFPSFNI